MSEVQPITTVRPDLDIREDIITIIAKYPPLAADRFHIEVNVVNGEVILTGHVSSPINRTYLVYFAAQVEGVKKVDTRHFYDDESLRLAAGRLVPQGTSVNVRSGVVLLSGVPVGDNVDAIAQAVAALPGVIRVIVSG